MGGINKATLSKPKVNTVPARQSQKSQLAPGAMPENGLGALEPRLFVQRKCACGVGCPGCQNENLQLQPKLKIGSPNDEYEQEPDQVADPVMRMPDSQVQRQFEPEDEEQEAIQAKFAPSTGSAPLQRPAGKEESVLSGHLTPGETQPELYAGRDQVQSSTGMPYLLKAGLEAHSGMDLSGVRVHNNSPKPAQLSALAYTQGLDIHIGPGQERYLPHEGWHVVQQLEKRVNPTMQEKGVWINDDARLEREADVMGVRALQKNSLERVLNRSRNQRPIRSSQEEAGLVQRQEEEHSLAGRPPSYRESSENLRSFSVNRTTYDNMVSRAIGQLRNQRAENSTFAPVLFPMLRAMYSNRVWLDVWGNLVEGGPVSYTFPGQQNLSLNLALILDDGVPQTAGRFTHDASNGRIIIKVRRNHSVNHLAETIYHEVLHLVAWLVRTHGPSIVQGISGRALAGIDINRHLSTVNVIKRNLVPLQTAVNSFRQGNGGSPISAVGLERVAAFLIDEVLVRAETDVFLLSTRTTNLLNEPSVGFLRNYIFNHSGIFLPADINGLGVTENQTLVQMAEILGDFYNLRIRTRGNFGSTAEPQAPASPIDSIQSQTDRGPLGGRGLDN